jgi:CheY-like chemotaxis protein
MTSAELRTAALEQRIAELQDDIARRDHFLHLLAHELRTPLSAIVGWADLMRVKPFDPEGVRRGAQAIDRSARVQVKVIDDLLDISRIATRTVSLGRQPVYLTQVLGDAIDTVAPALSERGVNIAFNADLYGGTVLGDHDRLQQILTSMLTTASELASPPGRIEVLLARDDVRARIRVFYATAKAAATGDPHLFERVRHLETGLSLTVARQLAELHGGTLEAVSSAVSDAFAFTLTLPLLPLANATVATGEGQRHPCAGLRVLVVDDEQQARLAIEQVLATHGAAVDIAANTVAAVSALARTQYDVLVSDLAVPYDDGLMLLHHLRRTPGPNQAIPAVALSAHASTDMRSRAVEAGFTAYVTKPVAALALVNLVATVGRTVAR